MERDETQEPTKSAYAPEPEHASEPTPVEGAFLDVADAILAEPEPDSTDPAQAALLPMGEQIAEPVGVVNDPNAPTTPYLDGLFHAPEAEQDEDEPSTMGSTEPFPTVEARIAKLPAGSAVEVEAKGFRVVTGPPVKRFGHGATIGEALAELGY